ncbi:DDE-type integrase/transposase/recombinase, partial [Thiorhodococcus minor]|uniref:DDE-type integrase/transposase/recombinase n=1 Tax=Thiorhodococcus minor TaxID=57489 RepID=UPI001ADC4EB8
MSRSLVRSLLRFGRPPGLHLLQVRLVDTQDDVHVCVLSFDRQPVLLGHALGLVGGHAIPGSHHTRLSEKTIEAWYYAWQRGGIEALAPKARADRGQSKIPPAIQEAILAAKREHPRRSIDRLCRLLERRGQVAAGALTRSAVHRLLQAHGLSRPSGAASEPQEHRAFVAEHAGDIWYGDVMHGPRVPIAGRLRKAYLVSLMDDASRLIAHSAFRPGETALDIEAVLKQAVLKRGLPVKLVIDNGPAYRAKTLQGICARLGIHLV